MATNERTKKRIAEGGRQISALLNKDEAELLARLEADHGGVKATIVAALKALAQSNELTDAELISTLKQRLERKNLRHDVRLNQSTEEPRKLSSENRIVAPPIRKNKDL